ncbi:hypothetical protein N1851_021631 [Merluccius polli]|uniref:FISNA domain-containing protein n=1 Tax=Merluccius polli TaxID=89951 RepID=A0AA47NYD1_MERPO|nr:hypothetical protein N1851_021631 [Merluccius polli]
MDRKMDRKMDPNERGSIVIEKLGQRVQQERADSPGPVCLHESDRSMDHNATFKDGNQSGEEASLCRPAGRESRTDASDFLSESESKFSLMFVLLQLAEEDAQPFSKQGAEEALEGSRPDYPQCSESQREEEEEEEVVDVPTKTQVSSEGEDPAWFEGVPKAGQATDLNEIYTEIFITEGHSGDVNQEHEVRLIETASRKPAKEETPIKCEDIETLTWTRSTNQNDNDNWSGRHR